MSDFSGVGKSAKQGAATGHSKRRQFLILIVAVIASGAFFVVSLVQASAARADYRARQARMMQLAADAQAIAELRDRPHAAAEQTLPQDDLIRRVSEAMRAAGMPPAALVSVSPQPPRQLPHSRYFEIVHRLTFEQVSMERIVRFCEAIARSSSALQIRTIEIRSTREANTWAPDIEIAYWLLNSSGIGK